MFLFIWVVICKGSTSSKGFTLFTGVATYKDVTQGQYITQCKTLTAVDLAPWRHLLDL
jgi:hypothetical protein